MILSIDVGGTKTLLGVFASSGELISQKSFPTDSNYQKFLSNLSYRASALVKSKSIESVGLAIPCTLSTQKRIIACGNLPWKNVNLASDVQDSLNKQVFVANDADCAGLFEANLGAAKGYKRVLYVTISTGIGTSLLVNGSLSKGIIGSEGGQMVFQGEHNTFRRFEDLISGPAIIERFGAPAFEISDKNIWKTIAKELAAGIYNMVTLLRPDVVVLGGGVAVHFTSFEKHLKDALKQIDAKLFPLPEIVQAKKVEQAALYGAYLLAEKKL